MIKSMNRLAGLVLLLPLALFQATPGLAQSDDLIKQEIEGKIAESPMLRGTRIKVHVERQLVVLVGQVTLYEQKLVADRIAWTTRGVHEMDNEIQVVPIAPLSDTAIERKITEMVKVDERFSMARVSIRVNNGKVLLVGSFLGFSDPSILKHKVAKIEGVVGIEIRAKFLA